MKITDDPSARDIDELDERVNAFNFARSGIHDARYLSILLRDDAGALYAGLHGYTWGGYCEIRLLWVEEDRRGTGLGSRLLRSAESEAQARGCNIVILTTHSFQAPEFYARHGYGCVAEVPDCPHGHAHLTLLKRIRA